MARGKHSFLADLTLFGLSGSRVEIRICKRKESGPRVFQRRVLFPLKLALSALIYRGSPTISPRNDDRPRRFTVF